MNVNEDLGCQNNIRNNKKALLKDHPILNVVNMTCVLHIANILEPNYIIALSEEPTKMLYHH